MPKDRTYRTYDDDDDEGQRLLREGKRLLRDGERYRVPLMMCDSVPPEREFQEWKDKMALTHLVVPNKPGFVTLSDNDACAETRAQLYDFQKAELSARYKGGLLTGDTLRLGDREMEVTGRNPENGKVLLADTDGLDAETLLNDAYSDYERDLNSAWQRDTTWNAKNVGDPCEVDGHPGKVVNQNGTLVCRITRSKGGSEEPSEAEWAMAGPLSDAESVRIKDEAYRKYADDLKNAWRR